MQDLYLYPDFNRRNGPPRHYVARIINGYFTRNDLPEGAVSPSRLYLPHLLNLASLW